MKNNYLRRNSRLAVECVVVLGAMTVNALAVWPPSYSMSEEAPASPAITTASANSAATPYSAGSAVEKLHADERRLRDVLDDLKKDEAALNHTAGTDTGSTAPSSSAY